MRYQWEQCPDANVNILHIQVALPTGHNVDRMADEDREFLKALAEIPGISSADTDRYTCQLSKAQLYDWRDIRPQVIAVLRKRFPLNGEPFETGPVFQRYREPASTQTIPAPAPIPEAV